jgi:hypothetical protein
MRKNSTNAFAARLPEVFASTAAISHRVRKGVALGAIKKLAPRLYTTAVNDPPEQVIRRNLWPVVALVAPGTVIAHRTAFEMAPAEKGTIFLSAPYPRRFTLPGLQIRLIRGPGPLDGDQPFLQGLWLASRPRAFLEVLMPTRVSAGVTRGLLAEIVEEKLEQLLQREDEAALNRLRDAARKLAPQLGADAAFAKLDSLIRSLLGTRKSKLSAPTAIARATGNPYDSQRLACFQTLHKELLAWGGVSRPDITPTDSSFTNLAFFDAYFSNFIEGTEFEVEEAHAIVFDGKIPATHPADAKDVLATYRIVGSRTFMGRSVQAFGSYESFEDAVRGAHADMLTARPDKRPGLFKEIANRAGNTLFVDPSLVRGTLRHGFELARSLPTAFARAAMLMFVLAEVHPFDDGNGRIARAFMNAELVAAQARRALVLTVIRSDYLSALRAMTFNNVAQPLIETLNRAQEYSQRIDFTSYDHAVAVLKATNAFEEPVDGGPRLRLP